MSDDLSPLLRAAALEREAAARDLPYSDAMLGRYVRDIRRRRAGGGAMLAVAGLAAIGAVAFGAAYLADMGAVAPIGPPTAPAVTPVLTPTPTPTPTPSLATSTPVVPPTSASPSAVPPPASSTAPPATRTTPSATPLLEAPGAVAGVQSGLGGGSGEVVVTWASTPGATGYRVYRSDVAAGPFVLSASFDVATARTTVAFTGSYESIQIWQPQLGDNHDLEYVEVVQGAPGYFRVTAFNAAGEGPMSGVVCSEPFGVLPSQC